jgi:hypothetical protein
LATEIGKRCSFIYMSEQENKSSFKPDLIFWGVAACLLALLFYAAMPNFSGTRYTRFANACIDNLRQIDAAANQLLAGGDF